MVGFGSVYPQAGFFSSVVWVFVQFPGGWCFGSAGVMETPPAWGRRRGKLFHSQTNRYFLSSPQLLEKSAPLVIQKGERHPCHSPPHKGQKLPGFNEKRTEALPSRTFCDNGNVRSTLSNMVAISHIWPLSLKMWLVQILMCSNSKNMLQM